MSNVPIQDVRVYADESIYDALGFIVAALVFSKRDLDASIATVLRRMGFAPGSDEFKSGHLMAANPVLQDLREQLFGLIGHQCKIAICICPAKSRPKLGREALSGLAHAVRKNGIDQRRLKVFFDRGMFRSESEALALASAEAGLTGAEFHFEQDSKIVLGLQAADAVAHAVGQVLRQNVTKVKKQVDIGGENTGYADGTQADLGWSLMMTLRNSFFVRRVVHASIAAAVDPATDPLIITDDDDPVEPYFHPKLLGWGVFISDEMPPELRSAVEALFDRVWLGCIH